MAKKIADIVTVTRGDEEAMDLYCLCKMPPPVPEWRDPRGCAVRRFPLCPEWVHCDPFGGRSIAISAGPSRSAGLFYVVKICSQRLPDCPIAVTLAHAVTVESYVGDSSHRVFYYCVIYPGGHCKGCCSRVPSQGVSLVR